MKQLASKVDVLSTHNKMLKVQIAQEVSSSSTPTSRLPSKSEPNPKEQRNAMILRGGKQLKGPKGGGNDVSLIMSMRMRCLFQPMKRLLMCINLKRFLRTLM